MDANTVDVSAVTSLILSGKYLVAMGTILVPLVGVIRILLAWKWKWFNTKPGGYVLAYLTTFLASLGVAWKTGIPTDSDWFVTTLGAGAMSSGLLDHWRDIVNSIKKTPVVVTTAALVLILSCTGTRPTGGTVITSVVNCASPGGDLTSRIETEALKMASIAFGPDLNKWNELEAMAVNDGLTIGGCAFSKVVNDWLSKKSLVASSAVLETQQAKSVFENYRTVYTGGATFHFSDKDL